MGFELEESIADMQKIPVLVSKLKEIGKKADLLDEIEDYVKSHYVDELGDPIVGRDNHGSVAEYSIAIGEFVAMRLGYI